MLLKASFDELNGIITDKAKKVLIEKTPAGLIESFDGKVAVVNLDANLK